MLWNSGAHLIEANLDGVMETGLNRGSTITKRVLSDYWPDNKYSQLDPPSSSWSSSIEVFDQGELIVDLSYSCGPIIAHRNFKLESVGEIWNWMRNKMLGFFRNYINHSYGHHKAWWFFWNKFKSLNTTLVLVDFSKDVFVFQYFILSYKNSLAERLSFHFCEKKKF